MCIWSTKAQCVDNDVYLRSLLLTLQSNWPSYNYHTLDIYNGLHERRFRLSVLNKLDSVWKYSSCKNTKTLSQIKMSPLKCCVSKSAIQSPLKSWVALNWIHIWVAFLQSTLSVCIKSWSILASFSDIPVTSCLLLHPSVFTICVKGWQLKTWSRQN